MLQPASSPSSHPPSQHPRPGAGTPSEAAAPRPVPSTLDGQTKLQGCSPRGSPPLLHQPRVLTAQTRHSWDRHTGPCSHRHRAAVPPGCPCRCPQPVPSRIPGEAAGWGNAAGLCPQPSAPSGDHQQHPPRALGTGPARGRTHSQPHCFPKTRLSLGCAQEPCQEGAGTKLSAWEHPSPWLQGKGALCPVPQAALPRARSCLPQPTRHCPGEGARPQSWAPAPTSQPQAGLFLLAWAGAARRARSVRILPWGLVLLLMGPSREKRGPGTVHLSRVRVEQEQVAAPRAAQGHFPPCCRPVTGTRRKHPPGW